MLLIVSLALGLAIGRSLWSLGPEGELFEGTISHTIVRRGPAGQPHPVPSARAGQHRRNRLRGPGDRTVRPLQLLQSRARSPGWRARRSC